MLPRVACEQALGGGGQGAGGGGVVGGGGKRVRACNDISAIRILPPAQLWLPVVRAVTFWPISINQK